MLLLWTANCFIKEMRYWAGKKIPPDFVLNWPKALIMFVLGIMCAHVTFTQIVKCRKHNLVQCFLMASCLQFIFQLSLVLQHFQKQKHDFVCWSPPLARLNVRHPSPCPLQPPTPHPAYFNTEILISWKCFFPGRLHFHINRFQKSWLSK